MMNKEMQDRLRSKASWVVVAVVLGGVIKHYIPGISDDWQLLTDAIITILTVFGIFNDPTNKKGF
jgi:uncharacterized membrane protein